MWQAIFGSVCPIISLPWHSAPESQLSTWVRRNGKNTWGKEEHRLISHILFSHRSLFNAFEETLVLKKDGLVAFISHLWVRELVLVIHIWAHSWILASHIFMKETMLVFLIIIKSCASFYGSLGSISVIVLTPFHWMPWRSRSREGVMHWCAQRSVWGQGSAAWPSAQELTEPPGR